MAKYTAKRNYASHWAMVYKGDILDIDNPEQANELLRLGLIEPYTGEIKPQEIIVIGRDTGKPKRKNTRRK